MFGESKYDKEFRKQIEQLQKSIAVLSKNDQTFINHIQRLIGENKKQDDFDRQVIERLKDKDKLLANHTHLDYVKAINDLQKQAAELQRVSHIHQVQTEG